MMGIIKAKTNSIGVIFAITKYTKKMITKNKK